MPFKKTTEKKEKRFNIYTAVDIMDGKCVRLYQGNFEVSETYNNNPDFVAKRWKNIGAEFLHVIDLDGARSGTGHNVAVVKSIIHDVEMPVQVGGGIRSINTIEKFIEAGAERVILGSSIIKDPDLVKTALKEFGGKRVVLGLDCKKGYLAVEGWREQSKSKAIDVVNQFKEHGLAIVEYTDIERDGTLTGTNLESLEEFLQECKDIKVISSGGIGSIEHVYDLKKLQSKYLNIDGVIIGKALYAGKIKPSELYNEDIYY